MWRWIDFNPCKINGTVQLRTVASASWKQIPAKRFMRRTICLVEGAGIVSSILLNDQSKLSLHKYVYPLRKDHRRSSNLPGSNNRDQWATRTLSVGCATLHFTPINRNSYRPCIEECWVILFFPTSFRCKLFHNKWRRYVASNRTLSQAQSSTIHSGS